MLKYTFFIASSSPPPQKKRKIEGFVTHVLQILTHYYWSYIKVNVLDIVLNSFYQFAQRSRRLTTIPLMYSTCIVLVICLFLYSQIECCCYTVKTGNDSSQT